MQFFNCRSKTSFDLNEGKRMMFSMYITRV